MQKKNQRCLLKNIYTITHLFLPKTQLGSHLFQRTFSDFHSHSVLYDMLIHIIVCSLYILLLQSLASRCIIYHKYKDDVLFISELLMPNDAQVKYNLQNYFYKMVPLQRKRQQ